ncbi:hypothetical protein BDV25DRAFT_152447, partial [Aspergillus avenaceus]
MTSDERRCFSYFQHRTVPEIMGYFDSALWQKLVFQVSQAEESVYHAVVALSAIHADYETRGRPLAKEDLDNPWHRFAIDQCGRAFNQLSTRSASQDPNLREVTLVCCVLFVLAELMRGKYELAFTHLQNGLQILRDTGCQRSAYMAPGDTSTLEQSLVDAFAHLDVQSAFFGLGGLVLPLKPVLRLTHNKVHVFTSLFEARQVFDPLLGACFQFHTTTATKPREEILADYENLSSWQFDLSSQLRHFAEAFIPWYANVSDQRSDKERRGADIIYLHQLVLSMLLERGLLSRTEDVVDYYKPTFERILSMAESIIASFADRPSVLVDMGVIPPLFFVSTECPDPTVRWRAVRALHSWPHREGPWDSKLIAKIAMETIAAEHGLSLNNGQDGLEAKNQDKPFRVCSAFTTITEDQSEAV